MSIIDEYESLEVIGKGSFGTVRRVRHKDGQILVRKEIEYTSMTSQERNHIISELRILRELDHPHIVKYYRHDHIPEKKMIHIYMEYCEGGDLAKVIKILGPARAGFLKSLCGKYLCRCCWRCIDVIMELMQRSELV